MTRVLIVDDEWPATHPLRADLIAREHQVRTAATVDAGLDIIVAEQLDLIVLHLGSPDLDGVPVIRDVRALTPVPLFVLSGPADPDDKINALDAGADDYLTEPSHVAEILARFRAITRRQAGATQPAPVRVGRYHVDLHNHRVNVMDGTGQPVCLTRTEWRLLEALVTEPGKLITQRQLLERIWGPAYRGKGPNLRQYMAQLRHKFEADPARPRHLLTEFGVGCRFQP